MSKSGLKVIKVPVSWHSPITFKSYIGTPFSYLWKYILLWRWIVISIHSETALTAETPTPCNPPDTLYASLSNFPPACSFVIMTSAAEIPNSSWIPTGMPLPKSLTDKEPSVLILTSTKSFCPARCSSTALSTTSQIQ